MRSRSNSDGADPMEIHDFLVRAAECERLAQEATTESTRKVFLDIAAKWRALANDDVILARAKARPDGHDKPLPDAE